MAKTKMAIAMIKAERIKQVDEAMDRLIADHRMAEPDSSTYNEMMIDTVLRPYTKAVACAHADQVNAEEFAGIVEILCAQILIRLMRQTLRGDDKEITMNAATILLQNVADIVLEAMAKEPAPVAKIITH